MTFLESHGWAGGRGQGAFVVSHPFHDETVERMGHPTFVVGGLEKRGAYLPTTMIEKLPGTMAGRGRGFSGVTGGRGPNSAETR